MLGKPAHSFLLDIVLPLGISFHTFQSMSYVIDVYRGEQEAIRNPIDYALFICFFPQLVAGPIVRARDFFRDLLHWQAPSLEDDVSRGVFLIALGLTKKMAFADQFAKVANGYFGNVAAHPGMVHRLERRASPSACRSTSISPATPIWPSAWRSYWASISR